MVADELATSLARRFVPPNSRVLDPFCGTGRLLAAAKNADLCVGLDANPLACLLSEAKFSLASSEKIQRIREGLNKARSTESYGQVQFSLERKVQWFSNQTLRELGRIISWINRKRLARPELLVVAAALSATARQVSYARTSGWKLHRMSAEERAEFRPCAWSIFDKRLKYCAKQLADEISLPKATITCGNAKALLSSEHARFDVVLTSPPYGDSRTTVQYGAASSLCLAIVSRLKGLSRLAVRGGDIDGRCLGGVDASKTELPLRNYWAGNADSKLGRMVTRFLSDYAIVCRHLANSLKVGGEAVFVVGRRSTGGFRLLLDQFTIDCFKARGFRLVAVEQRRLQNKRVPRSINRYGRSERRRLERRARTVTMDSEIIVVLRKMKTARSTKKKMGRIT